MTDIIYIVNGSESKRIITEICGEYSAKTLNCLGEIVNEKTILTNGITEMAVPIGGMTVLNKI